MSSFVLQLHGVMTGRPARQPSDNPHRVMHIGALSALVSRCPHGGAFENVEASAMARRVMVHHEILLAYCPHHTLLPTRFGAFFSSVHAIRQRLEIEEQDHLTALQHLTNTQEFAIKLSLVQPSPHMAKDTGSAVTGAQFLNHRRKARDARQSAGQDRTDFAKDLTRDISAIAPAVTYNSGDALLHLGVLLSTKDRSRLQALLHDRGPHAQRLGLSLEATGPWPAYSFDANQMNGVACNGA